MIVFILLELAFAPRNTPILRKNNHQDLLYHFVNAVLPPMILVGLLGALMAFSRPVYASGFFHWISSVPLLIRFTLAVIIGDIGSYWAHRWSHELPLLWGFHRIHHQAETIDWLVTSRAHPFDMVFAKFCGVSLIDSVVSPKVPWARGRH